MADSTVTHYGTITAGNCDTPDSEYDELRFPEPESLASNVTEFHVNFSDDTRLDNERSIVPYCSLYKEPGLLKKLSAACLLPSEPVRIKITSYEKTKDASLVNVNPNVYMIEVQHGKFQWFIKRRYEHFRKLHNQLKVFRATLAIPFPSNVHRERRRSLKSERRFSRTAQPIFPRFPVRPEVLITNEEMETRVRQLENYLKAVLAVKIFREHQETLNFLEISPLSFVDQLGLKYKEGSVKKRAGDQRSRVTFDEDCCAICCCCLHVCVSCDENCGRWNERWLVAKDTWLGYIRPDTGEIGCVILMDHDFTVKSGLIQTGVSKGLLISNLSRQLFIKVGTKREAGEWQEALQSIANSMGSDFTQLNRFGAFAPVRKSTETSWFVDGADYMSAIADALEAAQEEIFIADWWLSPEIFMKRPALSGNYWRLDSILKRKAEEGVKVFVLLYKEVRLALGINSLYSKQALTKLHPNIKVIRHPDHVTGGVLFWAHHEKLVVVDQSVAFLGGIDLCYGRWDDRDHRLTDLGGMSVPTRKGLGAELVKTSHSVGQNVPLSLLRLAQSAHAVTSSTIAEAVLRHQDEIEKNGSAEGVNGLKGDSPRQSKTSRVLDRVRSVRDKSRVWAEEVRDKTRTLTEGSREWMGKHLMPTLREEGSEVDLKEIGQVSEDSVNGSDHQTEADENSDIPRIDTFTGKLWIGKDYTNFIVKDFSNLESPFQDTVDRMNTPRMPWHDIGVAVFGPAARDVARHFIQRWNSVKVEKFKENMSYQFLVPKSYERFDNGYKLPNQTLTNCQVLRSAGDWSTGIKKTEKSIHDAYVHAIEHSKHYIYVENQFFVSIAGPSDEVTNRIAKKIYERILRAHREGAKFRVYVVMPLLPGFEGQVGAESGTAIRCITHWNYVSICRGPTSLLGSLKAANINPDDYISFSGLRTHSELNGQLVSELIYVHSKLMIVDDTTVICGSANINDRSMNGKRDSELAIIAEDIEFDESIMDGQPYQAGRFASSLRKRLFREHLGLGTDTDIQDPVCDDFYRDIWLQTASTNTEVYEKVFRCLPTDSVTSIAELTAFQTQLPVAYTEPRAAAQHLNQIKGYIVSLPLNFLCKENLKPSAGTAEALLPTSVWT